MSKTKIIVAIVGSALTAGLATAVNYFPNLALVLAAVAGLITAVVGTINGKDNKV